MVVSFSSFLIFLVIYTITERAKIHSQNILSPHRDQSAGHPKINKPQGEHCSDIPQMSPQIWGVDSELIEMMELGLLQLPAASRLNITHLLHLLFERREHFAAFGKGVLELLKLLCVQSQLWGETAEGTG